MNHDPPISGTFISAWNRPRNKSLKPSVFNKRPQVLQVMQIEAYISVRIWSLYMPRMRVSFIYEYIYKYICIYVYIHNTHIHTCLHMMHTAGDACQYL